MTGDSALDRLDALEPDPVKVAEDRVAEAGDYYELVYRDITKGRRSPEEFIFAMQCLDDATRALTALRGKLESDEIPFLSREI